MISRAGPFFCPPREIMWPRRASPAGQRNQGYCLNTIFPPTMVYATFAVLI